MKTAKDVAKEIVEVLTAQPNQKQFNAVAQALTAYADERVKEAVGNQPTMSLFIHNKLLSEARAEAHARGVKDGSFQCEGHEEPLPIEVPPASDQELLMRLRSGFRFTVTTPGDWEFIIGKGNRLVLRRCQ